MLVKVVTMALMLKARLIQLSWIFFFGLVEGSHVEKVYVSPSGNDSSNCSSKQQPCRSINFAVENFVFPTSVFYTDGGMGDVLIDQIIRLNRKQLSITFASYNGTATIRCVRQCFKGFLFDASSTNSYTNLTIANMSFYDAVLISTWNEVTYLSFSKWLDISIFSCLFEFKSNRDDVLKSLFVVTSTVTHIKIHNCTIRANYNAGLIWLPPFLNPSWLPHQFIIVDTVIENTLYGLYAIFEKSTHLKPTTRFTFKVLFTKWISDMSRHVRFPQIGFILGKFYRSNIWAEIDIFESYFQGFKCETTAAAIMDVDAPSLITIRNTTFKDNVGRRAGALASARSLIRMSHCVFQNNRAEIVTTCGNVDVTGNGGAMSISGISSASRVLINDCLFLNNSCACLGNSLYFGYLESIAIKNTKFEASIGAGYSRGAMLFSNSESLKMLNISFRATRSAGTGGKLIRAHTNKLKTNISGPSFFECPYATLINAVSDNATLNVDCIGCPDNTYGVDIAYARYTNNAKTVHQPKCEPCPYGAVCKGKITPLPNFWGYIYQKKVFMLNCPSGYCCQATDSCSSLTDCSRNREGTLCGRCSNGYTLSFFNNDCLDKRGCRSNVFLLASIVGLLVLTLFICFLQDIFLILVKAFRMKSLAALKRLCLKAFYQRQEMLLPPRDESEAEVLEITENDVKEHEQRSDSNKEQNSLASGLIKIVFFFYQTNAILEAYKNERATGFLNAIKHFFSAAFNLQPTHSLQFVGCPSATVTTVKKTLIKSFIPYTMLTLTASVYAAITMTLCCLKVCARGSRFDFSKAKSRLLIGALQLVLLGYSTMSANFLLLLTCISLQNGEMRLRVDANVTCYQRWQYLMFAIVLTWTLPLAYTLHKATSYLYRDMLTVKQFALALAFPLLFVNYSVFVDLTKANVCTQPQHRNKPTEEVGSRSEDENYYAFEEEFNNKSLVLQVIGGPFRYIKGKAMEEKLHWEAALLVQRMLLLSAQAIIFEPILKSFVLLLLLIVFGIINILYMPFKSALLNFINGITFMLLAVSGAINLFYAVLYQGGLIPHKGPLSHFIVICDTLEVVIGAIVPFFVSLSIVLILVAKLVDLAITLAPVSWRYYPPERRINLTSVLTPRQLQKRPLYSVHAKRTAAIFYQSYSKWISTMGNLLSRHKAGGEKQRLKEQISELSVMLYSLQQEVAFQKSKIEERDRQIDDATKENGREMRTCSEKVAILKEVMERTLNRVESEIQACKAKVDQGKTAFDEDKKHLSRLVECQEGNSKELIKAVNDYKQQHVSLEEFTALKASLEALQSAMEMTKESVPQPVRRLIKQRSCEWDKEVLEMVEKYQETRGFLMELITLDLSHERDIVGMKHRLEKLEECTSTSQKSSGEFLPTPSLPEIERLKSVHSEAPASRKSLFKPEPFDVESYQLKISKISSVMKRMKEGLSEAKLN